MLRVKPMRNPHRTLLAWGVALASSGCVERYLEINSNPTGARIAVNGRDVGVAPVTVPFTHYGTFRIDAWGGEQPAATHFESIDAPWYQHFPIDLASELLDPRTHVDRHTVTVELPPASAATPRAELLDRAEALRQDSR